MVWETFFAGLYSSLFNIGPRIFGAVILVALGYPLIRKSSSHFEKIFSKSGRDRSTVKLFTFIVSIFLYYSLALAVLAILGFSDLASSLGTAIGFIGLGIAFAIKDMIAEVVAGVYLLKDRDFSIGDQVVTSEGSGEVLDIDLRKTRLKTAEGDKQVLSNETVYKKWTKKES